MLHQKPLAPIWPQVTVVVPCKGDDHELKKNLEAIIKQGIPAHEIIFVTAIQEDPAQPVFNELKMKYSSQKIRCLVAGISNTCGEKVNNLLRAVENADPSSEIFVFADSDAQPAPNWLFDLVAPLCLKDSAIGATTGYRWYLPERRNPAGVLRSAWNAGIATLLGPHERNFCWGGSMAIRKETFNRIQVRKYWEHSISDDYSMAQALRDAKLRVHYVPQCLIPSRGRTSWKEVFDWSARQLIITKVYSNKFWKLAILSQSIFSMTVLLGGTLLPFEWQRLEPTLSKSLVPRGDFEYLPVSLTLATLFLLGFFRGFFRWRSTRTILAAHRAHIDSFAWAYIFLPPWISLFSTLVLWRSAFTNRVEWRGRVYELISPNEVRVLK